MLFRQVIRIASSCVIDVYILLLVFTKIRGNASLTQLSVNGSLLSVTAGRVHVIIMMKLLAVVLVILAIGESLTL